MPIIVTTMQTTNTAAVIKLKMDVDGRCMDCMFRTFERLMDRFQLNEADRQRFFQFYNVTMAKGMGLTMPQIHRELNREFFRITKIADPYADEKLKSNLIALKIYDDFRPKVIKSQDPFDMALRLSIAGNIMDYGPNAEFDIQQTIEHVMQSHFAIDHSSELKARLKEAKRVLYLGDNTGEIVFDKLFIEMIMHNNLTYAVRGATVLNDATFQDAEQIGMDQVADVITNGYDAASTVLKECSQKFVDLFQSADVIISKGQGNLEGLIDENDPRVFYLLMVKCDVIAELLKVSTGSFVVYNSKL
ncbi:MAG: ARMT1-like domain-containing protein [Paludibacter sp.]|nr:ARMT1-like domain-containing protein [Paludibacter sp.]MDD4197817.1 ARMT1-like domain-containing protein [Paludibacter sp.]MDD4427859.1 ARMT1-like domain-containing protein [Paludibacter sp.]